MSDLLNGFTFDIQRFTTVIIDKIDTVAADSQPDKTGYYWGEDKDNLSSYAYVDSSANDSIDATVTKVASVAATEEAASVPAYSIVGGANTVTKIMLSSDRTHAITIDSGVTATITGLGSAELSIYTAEEGTENATLEGLQFTDAGSKDSVAIENGKLSSITLTKGTLAVDSAAAATEEGIKINSTENATKVNVGFVYSASDKSLKMDGSEAVVTNAGDATFVIPDDGETSITIGEEAIYNFANESGSLAFHMKNDGATADGIYFGGTDDALTLDEKGITLVGEEAALLAYGGTLSKPNKFQKDVSLAGIASNGAVLKMTGDSTFSLDSLVGGDAVGLKGAANVAFAKDEDRKGAEGGGSVEFNAGTGVLVSVSVDSGAAASFTNFKDTNIAVNGTTINVGTKSAFYYNLIGGAPVLDFADCEEDESLKVTSAGDATQILLGANMKKVSIGSAVFEVLQGESGDDTPIQNAFVLDGSGNVTGFIFNVGGKGKPDEDSSATTLQFSSPDALSDFKLYYGDTDTELEFPKISGTGKVTVGQTVKAEGEPDHETLLVVGKGTILTLGDTVIDFSGIGAKEYALVSFTEDGFTRVLAASDLKGTINNDGFAASSSIVVTGAGGDDIANSIVFNTANSEEGNLEQNILTETGNYDYGVSKDGKDTVLALNEASDTIYGTGDATKVFLSGASGTIVSNDKEFVYASGGNAYFEASNKEANTEIGGSLTGFVFYDENDALTLPDKEDMPEDFTLKYYDNSKKTVSGELATPTVESGQATITLIQKNSSSKDAIFEVSGMEAGSNVKVGDEGKEATFTFGSASGAVQFDSVGAVGFTSGDDNVSLDAAAAKLMTVPSADKKSGKFSIDGSAVLIDAKADESVIYSGSDKSLFGLGDKAVVSVAGDIEKIYATSGENTFSFYSMTDKSKVDYKFTSQGTEASDSAYFAMKDGVLTGFVFAQEDDAITLTKDTPADFTLQDGAEGESFTAPLVYRQKGGKIADYTVIKGEENFKVNGLKSNYFVQFGNTEITFSKLSGGDAGFAFDSKGNLVSIIGLAKDEEVQIEGATAAIKFGEDDEAKEVEIIGGGFVYKQTDSAPEITEVKAGATIKQVAGATVLTTSGTDGIGKFTFAGESTVTFDVAGTDSDGVQFQLEADSVNVAGISNVADTASVTAAFFGNDKFSFNGKETELTAADKATEYTFSGTSIAGLVDGDAIVSAGDITDFITNGSGSFAILENAIEIADDKDGVTFNFASGSFAAIEELDKDAKAIGDFSEGLTVNGKAVEVIGDETAAVYGLGADGIAKIGSLSGAVEIAAAEGATAIGADKDAELTFSFAGDEAFTVEGNGAKETWFELGSDSAVAAIIGVDVGEAVTGNFENEIAVNGSAIQVSGDSAVMVYNSGTSGLVIADFGAGAVLEKADGVKFVETEEIADGDVFTFVGGQSFKFTGADADGVEFEVKDGKVVAINGLSGAAVTGDLNGIVINGSDPAIQIDINKNYTYDPDKKEISDVVDGNKVVNVDGAEKVFVAGASFTVEFANGKFTAEGAGDGVTFLVQAPNTAVAVADLGEGATLSGAIGELVQINGASVIINNDDEFSVVGKEGGIAQILDLSDGAEVVYAGGASVAKTDKAGEFKFTTSGQEFTTSLDDVVDFVLDETGAVTGIAGLSGAVEGKFEGALSVNDQTFEIVGDADNEFTVYGTDDEKGIDAIMGVGGTSGVTVKSAGGAEGILTDMAGSFTFASGQEFETDDEEVAFTLDGDNVTEIDLLTESITGKFDGISSVNDASFDVQDADGILTIVGNESMSGIEKIAGVDGGATINDVGGAKEVITASEGAFTFAGHSAAFEIAGDSSVTFKMVDGAAAQVAGITDIDAPVTITGELGAVAIDGVDIDITGDEDNVFSYALDENGAVLGEVGGEEVTINGVGGASKVEVVSAGKYAFPTQNYELEADSATFVVDGDEVTAIEDLEGAVIGDFRADGFTVNGKGIQIAGDSAVGIIGESDSIDEISKLSGGAIIVAAEGVSTATTDKDGTFTFADGREIAIAGDSEVTFALDGKGNLVSINDLDDTAIVSGDLNGVLINNEAPSIMVIGKEGVNKNLTLTDGILFGLVDGDTVISADGVSAIVSAGEGTYTFGMGGASFSVLGDSNGVVFAVEKGTTNVIGIGDVDEGKSIMVHGPLNGIAINGDDAIEIEGDDDNLFGVFANADGIAAVGGVGGSAVTIKSAGGASFVFTEEGTFGEYTFEKSGQTFGVLQDEGGKIPGVGFELDGDKVVGLSGLNGLVAGDFSEGLTVNGEQIQVEGDPDGIIVAGDDAKVIALDDVDAGATVKAWGSAEIVGASGVGEFTFAGAAEQKFTVTEDDDFAFVMGASAVMGVEEFENGTLAFDTVTTALDVNVEDVPEQSLTFETTDDVTLTIEDSKVVGVSGITEGGSVDGLVDATVAAEGLITVNGKEWNITDDDDKFNVVVEGGEATKATDVTGDATINVASGIIETDADGAFIIGGESWAFTDDDGKMTFGTDENSLLASVDDFVGTMEIDDANADLIVNGDFLEIASGSSSPVTVTSDGEDITAVDGLVSGDEISGSLDKAAIAMVGTSSTLEAEATELTVNGDEYKLLGDGDGVVVNGSGEVTGLDDNASLIVEAGNYKVNGQDIEAEEDGTIIVGAENGNDAYIYDPENILVRKNTPVDEIENMLGLPKYDDAAKLVPPPVGPLTAEELEDALEETDRDQPMEVWTTNEGEKTPQDIDFSDDKFTKKVHLYGGPQNLAFNDDGGNLVVVESEADGEKNIEFGDGGDVAIIDESAALGNKVNITGGEGDDSVFVRDNVDVTFDMSEGGADKLITYAGANARVTLEGYDYKEGAGIKVDERTARDIAEAIAKGSIAFGDGVVSIIGSKGTTIIDIGSELGGAIVNLFTPKSEKQVVAFTGSDGGSAGDATATDDMILIGNNDGKKSKGSNLTGGSGNDTAIAGAGDNVDLGAGNNHIILENNDNRGGAEIVLAKGRTTIENMNNTLDETHGDVLKLNVDLEKADVSFDGTNLIVEGEDFYAVALKADTNGSLNYDLADSADETTDDLVATDSKYTNQIIKSGDDVWKSAIGAEGAVMQVAVDEDVRANYYKGDNSGVTFAGYTGDVVVDLAGNWAEKSLIDGKEAKFSGINSVKAGLGDSQIKGSDNNETLLAGRGNTSLYADGGNNLMMGYNGTDGDKEGSTTFLVLGNAADAANTITGFEFISDDNYTDNEKVTADKLEVDLNTNHVEKIDISGDDVLIEVVNNTNGQVEKAVIEDAVGENIRLNDIRDGKDVVAQVNTDEFTVDKYANYFYATEKNATVKIDSRLDDAIVWLDGSHDKEFVGDFRVIDATGAKAKAELAGNDYDNTITAGTGETSLWGGNGGDDVMYGGSGKDTFFYAYGNGNDTVNGANDGDVINLAVSLDQFTTDFDTDGVTLHFTDGGSLTVNDGGNANVTYHVQGDNSDYYRDGNEWKKKA